MKWWYVLELTFRESFTTNVKKNINKLKAQAQAIMSTDEITPMTPDEELEEDDNSEEEEEEEYNVEREGWKVIDKLDLSSDHEALLHFSP